jgi:hypothetical protein
MGRAERSGGLCCNKLIQDLAGIRNNDSKEPALRFDSYKFPLHRAHLTISDSFLLRARKVIEMKDAFCCVA